MPSKEKIKPILELCRQVLFVAVHMTVWFVVFAVLRWFTPLYHQKTYRWPMKYNPHNGYWSGPDSFSYPKVKIISDLATALILFWVPVTILVVTQRFIRNFQDFNAALFGVITAVDIMTFFLVPLKLTFPYPRPTFLVACQVNQTKLRLVYDRLPELERLYPVYLNISGCANGTNPTQKRWDDLRYEMNAFPSGTTANTFAVGMFLAMYLNAKLKPFSTTETPSWKWMAVFSPVVGAAVMTVALLQSNNNFPSVFIFSAILGSICAYFGYRSKFRSVFDNTSNHIAFKDRHEDPHHELPFHKLHVRAAKRSKDRRKFRTE